MMFALWRFPESWMGPNFCVAHAPGAAAASATPVSATTSLSSRGSAISPLLAAGLAERRRALASLQRHGLQRSRWGALLELDPLLRALEQERRGTRQTGRLVDDALRGRRLAEGRREHAGPR